MMKVAVYYRVSTKKQQEKESIQVQQLAVRPWLEEKGWQYTEFQDDGISGEAVESRPGFSKMLAEIAEGNFDALVVYHPDRIGRLKKRRDRAYVIGIFEEHLKQVFIYDGEDEFDYNASSEEQMDDLERLLVDARKENRWRAKKIRGGQKKARLQGRHATGRIPYTVRWNKEDGKYELDEKEAATLKGIVRLIKEGYSTAQIAKILNGSKDFSPPRHAKQWSDGLIVRRIRTDFHFTGEIVSKKHGTKTDTGIKLFSKQELTEARNRMAANRKIRKPQGGKVGLPKESFLLYQIAKCTCGWNLMASGYVIGGKTYEYYRCKKCGHGFKAAELERAVWMEFLKAHTDTEALAERILNQEFVPLEGESAGSWHARLTAAEGEIKEVEKARDEMQVEYFTKKRMKPEVYGKIMDDLKEREATARGNKDQAEKALMRPAVLQAEITRAVNAIATHTEWVAELDQMVAYYEKLEKVDPAIAKEFLPFLEQGRQYLDNLDESILTQLNTYPGVCHFVREQKRKVLADNGAEVIVSRDRQIIIKLVASEPFNLDESKLIPA
jgi:DNA invertase Pin-like site-specific DNA recombinase